MWIFWGVKLGDCENLDKTFLPFITWMVRITDLQKVDPSKMIQIFISTLQNITKHKWNLIKKASTKTSLFIITLWIWNLNNFQLKSIWEKIKSWVSFPRNVWFYWIWLDKKVCMVSLKLKLSNLIEKVSILVLMLKVSWIILISGFVVRKIMGITMYWIISQNTAIFHLNAPNNKNKISHFHLHI